VKVIGSRTISHEDREFNPQAVLDPSSAQIQLFLAQMKRDHGDMSGREMEQAEIAAAPQAARSRVLYNPFTGEFRREFLSP
jgi:hypothetical protein